MNNDNPQLIKAMQHPTAKYDYDGITGTWLLIPAKFHILMLAIALPIILWMLPFIHLKGNYRYVFADYRYYIAGAVTLFCIASALLSILKAKQVRHRIRPMSEVNRQGVTKPSNRRPKKALASVEKPPKIHIGHIKKSLNPLAKNKAKEVKNSVAETTTPPKEKVAKAITNAVIKTAAKNSTVIPEASETKPHIDHQNLAAPKPKAAKKDNANSSSASSRKKTSSETAKPKRKKNPKQMQLDL